MKKLALLWLLTLGTAYAAADEITFSFIELGAPVINLTSSPTGLVAGPALNIVVSDTSRHLQFPLNAIFNASTGPGVITSTPIRYEGEYSSGGSVSIVSGSTIFVSGAPMFDHSHLISQRSEDEGAFAGEFLVTSVDPGVLAMFGLGPKWNPDGSVSITFGQTSVTGDNLSAIIGGGTVTIETPPTIPEATTLLLFGSGILLVFGSRWLQPR